MNVAFGVCSNCGVSMNIEIAEIERAFCAGDFIGDGISSRVFELDDGKVLRISDRQPQPDASRNWLEFCYLYCSTGRRMQHMPNVHLLVPLNDVSYVAVVDRYYKHQEFVGCGAMSVVPTLERSVDADSIDKLHKEYEKYIRSLSFGDEFMAAVLMHAAGWGHYERWPLFDDMHGFNVMQDYHGELILTDPTHEPGGVHHSAYRGPATQCPDFELEMQWAN